METYNKSIPDGFPVVSVSILKKFQALHPILFKNGDEWSIDKHRKKLMDWLPSAIKISWIYTLPSQGVFVEKIWQQQ